MATASSTQSNDELLKSIFEMVESKGTQKRERKKRVMTAEQKAKAIENLAKGRAKSLETRRRKKNLSLLDADDSLRNQTNWTYNLLLVLSMFSFIILLYSLLYIV